MILPPATLGMLGGGQLGRFFVAAAHEMGYRSGCSTPTPQPGRLIADRHLQAAYDDYAALDALAEACAAVTTEFENVPADTLDYLAKFVPVRPAPRPSRCARTASPKKLPARQRPAPRPFAVIQPTPTSPPRLPASTRPSSRWPASATTARARPASPTPPRPARFPPVQGRACVLEQMLTLDYEVSVVLARDENGRVKCFPTVENQHTRGILDVSIAPARASGCRAIRPRSTPSASPSGWASSAPWRSSSS
jgi:5-(carboxyamino)imidazole ribonucleotide synthase